MSERPAKKRQPLHEERAFLALADALTPLIALIQGEKLVYVNPSGCALLGRPRESLVGHDFWEFALAEDQERIKLRELSRQAGVEQARRFTERVHHADGRELWIDYSVDVIRLDGKATTLVTGHDVTEQKKTEEALRKREQLFRGLYTRTPMVMWAVGWDGCYKEVSDFLLEQLGYERHEVIGKDSRDHLTPESRERLLEMNARSLEAKDWWTKDFPVQVVRKDGKVLDIKFSGVPEFDEHGMPQGWLCVATDFTEVNQAQEALRQSEERFRSAFENAAIGKGIATPDMRFQQVNRAYCAMFGYTASELATMSPHDLTHPDDPGDSVRLLQELLAGKAHSGQVLKHYRHKDGHSVWGEQTVSLVRDARGEPLYFLAEVVDVTERKRAEELLRDREAKLNEASRIAHVGHWEYDIPSDCSTWSEEFYRIGEVDPALVHPCKEEFLRRIHPDDRSRIANLVERAILHAEPYEFEARLLLDSGAVRWIQSIARLELDASGKPRRIYGVAQDITERKRAEDALRASEQRFRDLYTQAPVMMTVVGPDLRLREVSNFWLERFGYERQEVLGREAFEFVTPGTRTRLAEELQRSVASGGHVVRSQPVQGIRKDGTILDALVTSMLEIDAQGEFRGAVTVGLDVSHIRRAEEALRESEARYRALVEYAPEAIVVLDVESGKFVDLNENCERLFGYTREQLLGMGPVDFSPETQPDGKSSAEGARQQIERARHGETPIFEWLCRHASGRDMHCQVRLSRLPTKGRELLRSSVYDISELKMLQEKARHEDRMAAIGVLAAGVAHEIGNPLLALSMATQSLQRKMADEYAQKKLGLIREHVERISKIVRQMSDLARRPVSKKTACDLNRVVERSLEIIRYDKRAKEVGIRFERGDRLPLVHAVEDQLMQVCLNLGLNALDAVASNPPSRPRSLAIVTRRIERDGRAFVRAAFVDSGPGIPEGCRARIFEPFFTTKEAGKGTGLGLSVSSRIIEEHEGKLAFECAAQDGTEFYFELPSDPAKGVSPT